MLPGGIRQKGGAYDRVQGSTVFRRIEQHDACRGARGAIGGHDRPATHRTGAGCMAATAVNRSEGFAVQADSAAASTVDPPGDAQTCPRDA